MNQFLKKLDNALVIFESRSNTLKIIEQAADELSIPITIIGGMAVAGYGYERFTADCDVLVHTPNASILAKYLLHHGFKDIGSNKLQNSLGVIINICTPDVHVNSGSFPQPNKNIGISLIDLPHLLAMKIEANRSKDRMDFRELIIINKLDSDYITSKVLPLLKNQISRNMAITILKDINS